MQKNNKNNVSVGSILVGVLTLGLVGFSIFSLLVRLELIGSNLPLLSLFVLTGVLIGAFFGYKYAILTESLSFAFTSLIMVQSYWDATYDIQGGMMAPRVIVGLVALSIFTLNIFTGRLKMGTAKKQLRRTLGAR